MCLGAEGAFQGAAIGDTKVEVVVYLVADLLGQSFLAVMVIKIRNFPVVLG